MGSGFTKFKFYFPGRTKGLNLENSRLTSSERDCLAFLPAGKHVRLRSAHAGQHAVLAEYDKEYTGVRGKNACVDAGGDLRVPRYA